MEHIILTRFFCYKLHRDIFSEEVLSNGLTLMKKFLIPSLENQTNKNFKHIILINDNHNKSIKTINELYNLNVNYDLNIMTLSEFNNYRKTLSNKVIVSRIDNDDCVYLDAVNDTQLHFNDNVAVKFYGYKNGLIYDDRTKNTYLENTIYPGGGTNSQFQSLMFTNFQNFNADLLYDHSNVFGYFKENGIQINKNTFEINEKILISYIWVFHNLNDHYVKSNTIRNKSINLKKEDVKMLFGVIL